MKLYCNLDKKNIIITKSQARLIKEHVFKSDFDLHLLFEAELKDIYTKYYNNIPENDFWQIVKADPTYNPQREQKMGKYGKWLLNLKKKNLLKIEDLYKFTESLEVFDKVKNQLEKKDINQYQNGIDLYNAVKDYINGDKSSMSKSEQIRMLKNEQAKKAYEDEKWIVIMPKTEEAAKYYGKGTRWCTAAENNSMFNTYYKDGPLYILINKKNGQKYQFHLESDQFKDEQDSEIMGIIPDELGFTEGLLKFFNSLGGRWTEVMQEDRVGDNYVLYNQNGWIVFVNADNVMTIRDNNTHTEWFIETRDLMVVTPGEQPKYVYNTPLYKIWPAEVIDAVVEYDAFDEDLIYGYICGIKCDGSGSVYQLTSTNGQNFLYVDNDYEEQRILFAFNSQTYEVKQIINFYYDYGDVEFDGNGRDIRYLKLEYGDEISYYDLDTLQFVEEYIEVESAFVGKDSYSYIANDENYITFCMGNQHLGIPIPQNTQVYEILRVNKINFPYFLIDIHCSTGDFVYDVSNKKYINNSPIVDFKFTSYGIVLLPAEIDLQYKKYWSGQIQKFNSYINRIDHNEMSRYASAFEIFLNSGIASLFNINLLDNNVIFISKNGEIGTLTDFLKLQVTPRYTDLLIKMWQKITNSINKSEPIGENKNTNLKNLIEKTVRDILFEDLLTEATLDDIYTKYYSNIPQEDFWNIIKTDPTWNEQSPQKMGKYGKWLLNQYKQGKMKLEDLYKYRESLEAFHKYNRQLEKRDINAYGDGNALYDAVKQFIDDPEQATSKSDEIRRIKQDAEKVYEDNEWLILIPKTEEAAKYYGKGTRWCTAADNNNYFNYYNQDGPLYINIRKSDGEKFQFHFESEQFMDSSDAPLTGIIADEIGLSEGASEYYASLGGNQNYEINEHDHDDPDAEPEEETIYENEAGWKITSYPDSENCYVIAPDGAFYYVEYNYGIEDPDGRPLKGVLSDYFPADIIDYIENYLRNEYFYGLLLNIEPDDIKDYRHLKFAGYEKKNEYVDGVVITLKNQNALLYSINATDRRGQLIKDFGQDGYIYDYNLTEKLSGRYTDFRFLVVKNINSNKYNVFKQGNYIFEQDVDKISFSPNDNPSGIIGDNALITNGTPNSNMIIPPFQEGLHVVGCNYDGKNDLAIICHDVNSENNSFSQISIYSITKHQYLTSRLYDSITTLTQGDFLTKNHAILGYLMLDKGMPYIWISDLIDIKGKDYYAELEKIRNILNFNRLYNPDSENEVVLKNGNTTTLKDFYINLGIYDILKEIWVNNQNLIRK